MAVCLENTRKYLGESATAGATSAGNVATEDVVYMFQRMGIDTGLDLSHYIETDHWMSSQIKRELSSKVAQVGLPKA
jgi:isopropylmalate/homocitrate/citramalate synthase